MSLSAIPASLRKQVFERDHARCGYCRLAQFGQGAIFHINHVIPRSKGGATALDNLVLQCPHCSLHKSNKTDGVDPQGGEATRLFHPRQHHWSDHFVLNAEAMVTGLTPMGRVTIVELHMNDRIPRLARRMQLAIGLLVAGE